jgi:hypothetical protein
MNFAELSDQELIQAYSGLLKELKRRKIIRTKNIIGELGEYLAIDFYNRTPGLPKLQAAPPGTKNIDAISRNGERYSIKATTTNQTGVFYGLPAPDSDQHPKQKFEYAIVVQFDKEYELKRIIELSWNQFLEIKKWHSRVRAWNLVVSRNLLENCRIIFQNNL